ncbi:MAG: hypothetical protein KF883_09010 [Thermomicrobiales bacterium]|nr:hypothetical protein [Thermomicrobiales bacterium]
MAIEYVSVRWIRPVLVCLLAFLVTGGLIVLIGESLLNAYDGDVTSELKRRELWLGVGLTVGILAVAALLNSRPAGALGPLDKEVAIGGKPMRGELVGVAANLTERHGPAGTVADLVPGYTLYARNGALAEVGDILKSVEDVGSVQRTLIYGRGLHGAAADLWIPVEAITAVYPKTRSAFLAVAGDETESLGWNRPPASFSRIERPKETPLY